MTASRKEGDNTVIMNIDTPQKRNSILLYIMMFCIVFQSGSVSAASKANTWDFYLTRTTMIGLGLVCVVYEFIKKCKLLRQRRFWLFACIPVLAVINYLLYPEGIFELVYKIYLFIVFFSMFEVAFKRKMSIIDIYYRIILLIATFTIICYITIELIKLPIPYKIYYAPNGFKYKDYYGFFYTYSRQTIPRLSGLFWEPGMYVIHLNFAMWCYFVRKKHRRIQLGILLLNVIFAQSAMGYIVCAIIIATSLLNYRSSSHTLNFKSLMKIITPIAVVLIVAVVFVIKRKETNQVGDSYYLRLRDFVNGMHLFIRNPLFGAGYGNTELYNIYDVTRRGNSNGMMTWLYTTGLIGFTFAIYPFVFNIKHHSIRKIPKGFLVCFFIITILFNVSEPIYNLPIMSGILAGQYWLWEKKKI